MKNCTATVDNTFTLTIKEAVVASLSIGELRKVIESLTRGKAPWQKNSTPQRWLGRQEYQYHLTTPPARASTPVL